MLDRPVMTWLGEFPPLSDPRGGWSGPNRGKQRRTFRRHGARTVGDPSGFSSSSLPLSSVALGVEDEVESGSDSVPPDRTTLLSSRHGGTPTSPANHRLRCRLVLGAAFVLALMAAATIAHDPRRMLSQPLWRDENWVAVSLRAPVDQVVRLTATTPVLFTLLLASFPTARPGSTPAGPGLHGGGRGAGLVPRVARSISGTGSPPFWWRSEWPSGQPCSSATTSSSTRRRPATHWSFCGCWPGWSAGWTQRRLLTLGVVMATQHTAHQQRRHVPRIGGDPGHGRPPLLAPPGSAPLERAGHGWRRHPGLRPPHLFHHRSARPISPPCGRTGRPSTSPPTRVSAPPWCTSSTSGPGPSCRVWAWGPLWSSSPLVLAGLVTLVRVGLPAVALVVPITAVEQVAVAGLHLYPLWDPRTSTWYTVILTVVAMVGLAGSSAPPNWSCGKSPRPLPPTAGRSRDGGRRRPAGGPGCPPHGHGRPAGRRHEDAARGRARADRRHTSRPPPRRCGGGQRRRRVRTGRVSAGPARTGSRRPGSTLSGSPIRQPTGWWWR